MATTSAAGRLPAAYDSAAPGPPPPTPSAAPHRHVPHSSDPLSHLFLRLPPTLSLSLASLLRPSTASISDAAAPTTPPLVSLSSPSGHLLSAAAQLGFFHLQHRHHHLPAAVLEAESILLRRPDFSLSWPFGFDDNDADDLDAASFCFDAAAPPNDGGVGSALTELASSLEKVGLEVVEALTAGLRVENPFRDPSRRSCMVWVSSDHGGGMEGGGGGDEGEGWGSCSGRLYPYVVGVHCQMGGRRSSMQADSCWVTVAEAAETVLVTVGDIAQVLIDLAHLL